MDKQDPSFKSKRYRDKLRHETTCLEKALPLARSSLHRRLDSQTVFRLTIAYFRLKLFLGEALGWTRNDDVNQPGDVVGELADTEILLETVDGFFLAVTSDGTVMFVSGNILQHLGFNQVDLMLRCIYGIVHPHDQHLFRQQLEFNSHQLQTRHDVSFSCRMKCFSGVVSGYARMQVSGSIRHYGTVRTSTRTSNDLLLAFCRPHMAVAMEATSLQQSGGNFWTKHELDLKFKHMDASVTRVLGHSRAQLELITLYQLLHPDDLLEMRNTHRKLMQHEEVQSLYCRLEHATNGWVWFHTRGKLVIKNSKKYSIVFTHNPVRTDDNVHLEEESRNRQTTALHQLMSEQTHQANDSYYNWTPHYNPPDELAMHAHSQDSCVSSWHITPDRHSPVFPTQTRSSSAAIKRPRLDETFNEYYSSNWEHLQDNQQNCSHITTHIPTAYAGQVAIKSELNPIYLPATQPTQNFQHVQ